MTRAAPRSRRPGDRGGEGRHPQVGLRKDLTRSIRAGHPWLFAHALAVPPDLRTGRVVDVVDRRGHFVARGLYDADSPIGVRVWTLDAGETLDAALIARRVAAAAAVRRAVVDPAGTDAFRLVHGEGDGLPGLVCDRYADTAVLQLDSGALEPWLGAVVDAVRAADGAVRRVVLRRQARRGRRGRGGDGAGGDARHGHGRGGGVGRGDTEGDDGQAIPGDVEVLHGPPLAGPIAMREHGLAFEVDVARGHKTGFYLDQRESRRRVRDLAAGRRMLNVFAYTGGFSVAAAAGGAAAVTSVDIGAPVIEAARRNVALNGLDPDAGAFRWHVGDAFAFLAACREPFDLIVVDPPSMAPSRASLDRALSAYRQVNTLALGCAAPGALVLTCSCSSHVTADLLRDAVADAALSARRAVRILERRGAGPDHPLAPGFPEGDYLQALLLYVD